MMFVNPRIENQHSPQLRSPNRWTLNKFWRLSLSLNPTKFLPHTILSNLSFNSWVFISSRHLILSSHESWTRLRISTWSCGFKTLKANFIFWSELRFAEQTLIELKSIAIAISQVLKLINEGNYDFSNHHNLRPHICQTGVLSLGRSCDPNIETIEIHDHLWWWKDCAEHKESTREYLKSNEMLRIWIKSKPMTQKASQMSGILIFGGRFLLETKQRNSL